MLGDIADNGLGGPAVMVRNLVVQPVLNVAPFMPLGVLMRRFGSRTVAVTTAIGLGVLLPHLDDHRGPGASLVAVFGLGQLTTSASVPTSAGAGLRVALLGARARPRGARGGAALAAGDRRLPAAEAVRQQVSRCVVILAWQASGTGSTRRGAGHGR